MTPWLVRGAGCHPGSMAFRVDLDLLQVKRVKNSSFDFLKKCAPRLLALAGVIESRGSARARPTALGALGGFKVEARGRRTNYRSVRLRPGQGWPYGRGRMCAACRWRYQRSCAYAWTLLASHHRAAGRGFVSEYLEVAPEAAGIGLPLQGRKPLRVRAARAPFGAGSILQHHRAAIRMARVQVPTLSRFVLHRDAVSGGATSWSAGHFRRYGSESDSFIPHAVRFVKVEMDQALKRKLAQCV